MQYRNLSNIREYIYSNRNFLNQIEFIIPNLWINITQQPEKTIVPLGDFFLNKIDEIIELSKTKINSNKLRIYNSFPRLTSAFTHNSNTQPDSFGIKKTGTFIKTLALLPLIRTMGANVLYFLPITEIGIDGKKGELGSPYSIKNHLKFDGNLIEDWLPFSAEEQFSALVEAAHLLGIKVVLEFVFRTASKDNDLILEHPDWFYWVKSNFNRLAFAPPKFAETLLEIIKAKVENQDFEDLPVPSVEYRDLFCETPTKVWKENNKIYGITKDGELCEIPGAFADWPPDDKQPLWTDVTYLKLHSHPDFNYMAYNTLRMYDAKLRNQSCENTKLWYYLENIIPKYIENYDIDGAMIDMGHALPSELLKNIIEKAKKLKPNFLFFEENFTVSNKSLENGFYAVVGYLPFDLHILNKTARLINELSRAELKIKFFGTAETHNTPRAYWRTRSSNFSLFTYILANLLPNSIPFIHNGFELLDETPVNTGLDFERHHLDQFSRLPLFDYFELNWLNKDNIINEIIKFNSLFDKINVKSIQAEILQNNFLKVKFTSANKNYLLIVNYGEKQIEFNIKDLESNSLELMLSNGVKIDENQIKFYSKYSFALLKL